jgi:hypothetical protein
MRQVGFGPPLLGIAGTDVSLRHEDHKSGPQYALCSPSKGPLPAS